jgi:hypothetical protein
MRPLRRVAMPNCEREPKLIVSWKTVEDPRALALLSEAIRLILKDSENMRDAEEIDNNPKLEVNDRTPVESKNLTQSHSWKQATNN